MATFYVLRHAKAESRGRWDQDDRLRPLSRRGIQQAESLVTVLKPFPITAVYSSPFLRCLQTVEPLARALRLPVQQSDGLAEGHGLTGAEAIIGDPTLDHAVLSTHGDIVLELIEELVKRRLVKAGEGGFEKGAMWVVETEMGAYVRARYFPAP